MFCLPISDQKLLLIEKFYFELAFIFLKLTVLIIFIENFEDFL